MFCLVKGLEDLGHAKLLEVTGTECAIEFFDSPAADGRSTRIVASANVIRRDLGPNTRVYYQDPEEYRWTVGRVLDDGEDTALIRFANKTDKVVSHANLFVRWRRPIRDPTVFLSHGITETPQYANARSGFLNTYTTQRAAAMGISALMSSAIELEPHQIRVVSRVLNDASQRYLLADEVGLGKTIEAGVIIRQAVLDDPKAHRIVVIAPSSLTHQWRTELSKRFGLSDFLDDSVSIHSLENGDEIAKSLANATMLVVDEAHHLTSVSDVSVMSTYELVSHHARSIDRILLLSATPALRNEIGFLRLLHLLDPLVYRLEDVAAFKNKVSHRQTLAEAVAFLSPENVLNLDSVLDDLALKLPRDAPLQALIVALQTQLTSFPQPGDPELERAILQLRSHLSETYRLNRRILRNRRKRLRFLTPERRGSDCSIARGWQAPRIEALLEDWRLHAVSHASRNSDVATELSDFYTAMVSSFVEDPRQLQSLCALRLRGLAVAGGSGSFREDPLLLEEIRDAVADDTWLKTRLQKLQDDIRKLVGHHKKVVVFCAAEPTADEVFSYLQSCRFTTAVRHCIDVDKESSWRRFYDDISVKAIVCGPSAEEGLNLQGSERAIVHFDLPLAPNRIEQRIGRVDRYGSGSTIRSTVLIDEGSQLQQGWYTLLDRGLGVFHRSIASLQYLLEDELQHLKSDLFDNGSDTFNRLLEQYSEPDGKVTRELRLLDQQDALDELSPSGNSLFEGLEEADGDWKLIGAALNYWVVDTLLFDKVLEHDITDSHPPDPPYRFRYQKPRSGRPATLIPLAGFLYDFIGALDVDAPEGSARQPLSHKYSAHRKTAITRGARVLRYGDAFVEALKSFSDTDDRGRSFGIWRQHPSAPSTGIALYFRFDFLVEIDLTEAERCLQQAGLLQSAAARAAMRRRGDGLLPPAAVRVWVADSGEHVDPQLVAGCLSLPYSRDPATATHGDTNLSAARLHALSQSLPEIFGAWPERCARGSQRAHALVVANADLRNRQAEALRSANQEGASRMAQLAARIHSLEGVEAEKEQAALKLETALNEALLSGITQPSIKLDVAGFVTLSREPPAALALVGESAS
jgi:ATP-dependent helicase HepA